MAASVDTHFERVADGLDAGSLGAYTFISEYACVLFVMSIRATLPLKPVYVLATFHLLVV